ncbi:MAG: GDSL-type esterase/lipase family protein [Oligoflexia bacterium]|nr:GDSL-type esterase/lipase family protein [Oligoflexia bacterium]
MRHSKKKNLVGVVHLSLGLLVLSACNSGSGSDAGVNSASADMTGKAASILPEGSTAHAEAASAQPASLPWGGPLSFGGVCPSGSICSYSATGVDSQTYAMSCAGSSLMTVQTATYGVWGASESCLSYVQSACNGQSSCKITFDQANCGADSGLGTANNGVVAISCSPPPPVPLSFGTVCANGEVCSYSANQVDFKTYGMSCSAGNVLSIQSATYGVTGKSESCYRYVQTQCNGQGSCQITFNPTNCGGDPASGVRKNGGVIASCAPAPVVPGPQPSPVSISFGSSCPKGDLCTYSATQVDFGTFGMSCNSGSVLNIQSSTYGVTGASESCSSYVQSTCNGQNSCKITFEPSTCGGDPDYGVRKNGSVVASCLVPNSTPVTVMPLGDSNTWGLSAEGYRETLDQILQKQSVTIKYVGDQVDTRDATYANNHHEGLAGWATDMLLAGYNGIYPLQTIQSLQPQVVLLMSGTNDFFVEHLTVAQAEQNMTNLLNDIRRISPNSVIVVGTIFPQLGTPQAGVPPVPLGVTSAYDFSANVTQYNGWLISTVRARVAQGDPIHVVDQYSNYDPTQTVDGIHATPQGYINVAHVWAPEVANAVHQITGQMPASCASVLSGAGLDYENDSLYFLYYMNWNFYYFNGSAYQPIYSSPVVQTAQANFPMILSAVTQATELAEQGSCVPAQNVINQYSSEVQNTVAAIVTGK